MFQALLVIPLALAIVFFTVTYFQRDKVIAAANKISKDKKVEKVVTKAKKALDKTAKQVTAKVNKVAEKVKEQEQVIKNLVEEIDITEYASIQLKKATQTVNRVVAKVEKKAEEVKTEAKTEATNKVEEVQATIASPEEGKKKKKKTEWQTQAGSQKQALTVAHAQTEEKKDETTEEPEKKEGSRGVRGERGSGRGGRGSGRGRGRGAEQTDAPKSLYKPIKPTVVEEVKPVEEEPKKKDSKKDAKKDQEATVESTEEVEKKERKPLRPFVKMVPAHQAYSDPEDFWNTDLSKTYKEPTVEEVKPVVAEEVVTSPTEDPLTINDTAVPAKKEKAPRTRQPAAQPPVVLDEGMAPATIKVNNSASFARTDPWAHTDNASTEASTETKESFPALGEKVAKKKKAKKAPKEPTPSTTSQDDSSNNTLVAHEEVDAKNNHKREATNTLFEYDAEAPSDKKIKLEEGSQVEQKDEPFVLQTSSN